MAGQRLHVKLIDGTQVTLAPASHIRVPAEYTSGTRTVELQGEAYFMVVHNAAHPFAVETRDAVVRDIGTGFDVRSYAEDPATQVAVAEGMVTFASNTCSSRSCAVALGRGDFGMLMHHSIALTHNADIGAIAGWLQGRLVFTNTPLAEVARTLSRTFSLDVRIADTALARETVMGRFSTDSIDVILQSITEVLGATYHRDGRVVVIERPTSVHKRIPERHVPPLAVARAAVIPSR